MAGDYRVSVREPGASSPKTYLKSIRLGTSDILKDGLHVQGKPEGQLEIVLGTDVSTVNGDVVDQMNQRVANAVVALVPNTLPPNRPDLYRNASTDGLGNFHIEGIAPGESLMFAWRDAPYGLWQDPEFIRIYEPRGQRIRIDGASSENVQVLILQ